MKYSITTLEETDSTNNYLKSHPKLWDENFKCVRAITQTGGRGRFSRNWVSTIDDLTFSFIFKPKDLEEPAIITLFAGLALYQSLNKFLNINSDNKFSIKWPNDIYHNNEKLGGILTELIFEKKEPIMIVGIGINVNSLPEEYKLNRNVTSLRKITNETYDLPNLLNAILDEVKLVFEDITYPLQTQFQNSWNDACKCIDRKVNVQINHQNKTLRIQGLAKTGSLRCVDENENEVDIRDAQISYEEED